MEKIIINDYIQVELLADENLDDVLDLVTEINKRYNRPQYIDNRSKESNNILSDNGNEIRLSLPQKSIWLYSGYTWEQLFEDDEFDINEGICENQTRRAIVLSSDVFVDGRYIDSQRDITLPYRGSKNQRLIAVKKINTGRRSHTMDCINSKYYIKNLTKSSLKKKGFRYDAKASTKDCECYSYEFPVDTYKNTPVIMCRIRTFLDNGDVTIDVFDRFGSMLPEWYQRDNKQFECSKEYVSKIDRKIRKKLKILGIKKRERIENG